MMHVFKHSKEKSKPIEIAMGDSAKIRVSPVAANGRLYVVTENPTKLYAIELPKK